MTEPTDPILSMIQRIQSDVAELKRNMAELNAALARDGTPFGDQNKQIQSAAGLSWLDSLTRDTVEELRKEGEAVKQRLRSLETQP